MSEEWTDEELQAAADAAHADWCEDNRIEEAVRSARLAALREARAEIGYAHAEADEAGHRDTHGLGAAAALIDALIAVEEAKGND